MAIYKGDKLLSAGNPPIATTSTAGIVKPDGTTITVTSDGTISSQGGGASALTDLTDVAVSTPSNGQVLTYNNTTQKWDNEAVPVTDVQINGTTILTSGVANIPYALNDNADGGIVKVANAGIVCDANSHILKTVPASYVALNSGAGNYMYHPVCASATGLATKKALGVTLTSSTSNTTWTTDEQQTAQNTLSITGIPSAMTVTSGVVTGFELANNFVYSGTAVTELGSAQTPITYPASPAETFTAELNFTTGASISTSFESTITFKGDDCANGVFTAQASSTYSILFSIVNGNKVGLVIKL